MSLSRKERQQLQREERQGTAAADSPAEAHTPKKSWWKYAIIGVGILFLGIISFAVYSATAPSYYDGFAKCLNEKGAVMYGAMGWCKFSQGQKAMFGKSFKHVEYYEFTEFPKDRFGEIKTTPTWIINGKKYENVQSFEELSQVTGCPLP